MNECHDRLEEYTMKSITTRSRDAAASPAGSITVGYTRAQRLLLLLTLGSILTACGGGGGSSQPATQTDAVATALSSSLDDLVVAPTFNLQATFTLTVDIELDQNTRGYFSLCDPYDQSKSPVRVNFESCLLRGPLVAGQLKESLQVANHVRELMAVIWFYDGSDPIYQRWQQASADTAQELRIN